jgi:PadR family transcriptional regulator PadR
MNKFSFIELAILQMLEIRELHGYAMSAQMRQSSGGQLDLPAGSLYPALHKLERSGLIRSRAATEHGRKRRYYSLTAQGLQALVIEINSWRIIVKTMNTLLGIAS